LIRIRRGRNGRVNPQPWHDRSISQHLLSASFSPVSTLTDRQTLRRHVTVEVYTLSLKERTKLKGLGLLRRIYDRVPVKFDQVKFERPTSRPSSSSQAHFSRLQLPQDLVADQSLVLEEAMNLLSARVNVMSSSAWLNALGGMDLSQMCVQAVWDRDLPLQQPPHFEPWVSLSTMV
jgi:hypothetical protein